MRMSRRLPAACGAPIIDCACPCISTQIENYN
jgi:hypothetical protein